MISLVLVFIHLICSAFGLQFAQELDSLFQAGIIEAVIESAVWCFVSENKEQNK